MQYGYFDDQAREYVITRPDTPAPWANYLGSPEYGALISNNAGGYSFVKSGANGRILRYVFNQFDQPGRYLYLRDNETRDFWSASWQPVGKDLDTYRSQCRHGMGYTRMLADYQDIHSEAVYYVPLGGSHEVWQLSVTNLSDRRRELTLTGYAEFTNSGNYEQDQVNLQYSQFITRTLYDDNRIRQQIHGNLDAQEKDVTQKTSLSDSSPWPARRRPSAAVTRRAFSARTGAMATPLAWRPAIWAAPSATTAIAAAPSPRWWSWNRGRRRPSPFFWGKNLPGRAPRSWRRTETRRRSAGRMSMN